MEAHRIRQLITATSAPHLTISARRELLRQLERIGTIREPVQPIPKQAHDPQAAAAYFAARGIRVETTA